MEDLDHLSLDLEEKKKLAVVKKFKRLYKEKKP
jgi:hypothetical protein